MFEPGYSRIHVLRPLLLCVVVIGLYAPYLSSPLIFDDLFFFDAPRPDPLRRWLSYSTFEWTRSLAGDSIIWMRAGNLALHVANALLLGVFLRRLFEVVTPPAVAAAAPFSRFEGSRHSWLAFCGAAIFAIHPAAVFGVGYLSQRSILMATLFVLLSWLFFLEGMLGNRRRWLFASAAAYFLAVLSKENAIMAPAVTLAILVLVRIPARASVARAATAFLLYGVIGGLVVYWMAASPLPDALGSAYEPNAASMIEAVGVGANASYALSILTQCYLFFKYLFLWLGPLPSLVSIDMREALATGFWSWPQTAGLAAFVLYPLAAVVLLWRGGHAGLLGFAMLCPWLLFATELSTIRVQEIFVMYRSYLWMPGVAAAMPFVFRKWPVGRVLAATAVVTLMLVSLSWDRLATFSDPVLLWDEALRVSAGSRDKAGVGRIYHNRGVALLNEKRYREAIADFDAGIERLPKYGRLYQDRAVAYLRTGRYREALDDFDAAVWLDPSDYRPYLGRAQVYDALRHPDAARRELAKACRLGAREACGRS